MGVFYHLIDEITGMFAQVVFCRSQDALMVILGMGRDYLYPSKSSFIRNLTIFSTKSYGIGLSNGKCTEPFVPLYCDNSFLNASVPEGIGYSAI